MRLRAAMLLGVMVLISGMSTGCIRVPEIRIGPIVPDMRGLTTGLENAVRKNFAIFLAIRDLRGRSESDLLALPGTTVYVTDDFCESAATPSQPGDFVMLGFAPAEKTEKKPIPLQRGLTEDEWDQTPQICHEILKIECIDDDTAERMSVFLARRSDADGHLIRLDFVSCNAPDRTDQVEVRCESAAIADSKDLILPPLRQHSEKNNMDSNAAVATQPSDEPASRPFATLTELAGEYWCGEHDLYGRLVVYSGGAFQWEWHGDLGVYGKNHGSCAVVDDVLVVDPVDSETTFLGGKRFVPVRWGERLYLIPEATFAEFCEAIERGVEPRIHLDSNIRRFYLRNEDWDKLVSGLPRAPQRWQDQFRDLLSRNVEARVVKLWSAPECGETRHWVKLSAGAKDGLKEGMWLTWSPTRGNTDRRNMRYFAIRKVEEETCDAVIVVAGTPEGVAVGDKAVHSFCVKDPQAPAPKLTDEEVAAQAAAKALLEEMECVYANCRSYKDEGTIKSVYIEEASERTSYKWFSTAFIRPDRFRFAYGALKDGQKTTEGIAWRQADQGRTWDPHLKVFEYKTDKIGMVIAGFTGVSSGSSDTVPRLLLPDEVRAWTFSDMDELRAAGEEVIDGRACTCIRCKQTATCRCTVWVDRESKLIRQVVVETQHDAFRSITTTSYRPMMDGEVSAEDLAFDAPE